ncbi:MAG: TAXI family TRAP transporter solute-binding subunit [Treponemataceae bacterium]|nr:MAG: TAXI family TRAP transporter solute-binding subunit [Treponemataceae bacterium]
MKKTFVPVLCCLAALFAGCAKKEETKSAGLDRSKYAITVLTGPSSGIFYPIGGAFSAYLSTLGYKSSATATGATVENINQMLAGDGEMAIAMSDAVFQAYNGIEAFKDKPPAKDLRALMGLWPNVVQIVTTADSGIKTFADLRGRRVGVGAPNSGIEANARMIYEANGMTYNDSAKVDFLDYGTSIDSIKNGQCDAAFVTTGLGNATIQELGVTKKVSFVPVEGEALARLRAKYPFYIEFTIPADAYNSDRDVTTAAVMNIMIIHKDLPDEVVYDILENLWAPAGLEAIGASHATAKREITWENAIRGVDAIGVPLHDGAIKFYKDKGVLK